MNDNRCKPRAGDPPKEPQNDEQRRQQCALWAKALGHASRIHIIEILLAHEGCMCGNIVELIDLAQSTVSQHLKMLKDAGIIHGTIDGSRICYCVNSEVLEAMQTAIGHICGTPKKSADLSLGSCCPAT